MKKIIIISVLVIIFSALAYWLSITLFKSTPKISIISFNFDKNSNDFEKLIDKVSEQFTSNNVEKDFTFYLAPGTEKTFGIEENIDEWSPPDEIKKIINKTFIKNIKQIKKLTSVKKLTPEEANLQMQTLAKVITNQDNDNNIVFLVGTFPDCYAKKDVDKIIKFFNKELANKKDDNNTIYWMLRSNASEPEQEILNFFKKAGFKIKDLQINIDNRICGGSRGKPIKHQNISLEYSILSKINKKLQDKVIKKSVEIFLGAKNIKVGFHNDAKSYSKKFPNFQEKEFEKELQNLLSSAQKVSSKRSKFIFQDTFDRFKKNPKDTVFFFLLGENFQPNLRLYNFRNWRKRENQKMFLYFTPKSFENIFKNSIQSIFQYEVIQ